MRATLPSDRLDGKRVLLTGTAGGQGAAAQRLFAEHGARVAGCDVQPGVAEATAASTSSTTTRRGSGSRRSAIWSTSWRHVMRFELGIVFHTTSPAWRGLCDGGSVINTAPYSALRGIEPLAAVAHAAAKGGVIAMTRTLATLYLASDESACVTGQNFSVDGGVTAGFR
jgi:NAD(P)-dependent dehydrogenase (short-subunit alcohol dehydrogenase family)